MADRITSMADAVSQMQDNFNADAAAGVDATFQFDISGDNGGQYWIKVADQTLEVSEGTAASPSITIRSSDENYLKMLNGELAPMTAFMQGKVKVDGNMSLAMKLQSIFGL